MYRKVQALCLESGNKGGIRRVLFAAPLCLLFFLGSGNGYAQEAVQSDRPTSTPVDVLFAPPPNDAALGMLLALGQLPAKDGDSAETKSTSSGTTGPVASASSARADTSNTATPIERRATSPEPHISSRRTFLMVNSVMYLATVFNAFGRRNEVNHCKAEAGFANGVYLTGPYQGRAPATQAGLYAVWLPIDAGITLLSAVARRKGWHAFEIAAPLSAASSQITAGAFKFSAGCY
jgi:hypothetical protein